MLTENVCVNVLTVDVVVFGNAGAKSCGIKDSTGADDLVFGKIGALAPCVGKNINRVAYDNISSVGSVLCNLRNDGFNDINVGLREVESGLAGLSCNAGGENYDIGVACVAVCSGIDGYRRAERCSLANVKRFSESLLFIDVDHYDLGCYTAYSESISNCRADASCANNGNFCHKSSSKLKFL